PQDDANVNDTERSDSDDDDDFNSIHDSSILFLISSYASEYIDIQ
ncbi:34686_t:CDS:2, partial [Racocetra persica]